MNPNQLIGHPEVAKAICGGQRMAKLGLLPSMQSLTLIVSPPMAIETSRKAA